MLGVVVERPVEVGELAAGQRHGGEPVVVEGRPDRRREGQRPLQQLAPEERGGAGHGVRQQQPGEVGVVVAPSLPEGLREHPARLVDDPHVAVDEPRPAARRQQRRQLLRVPAVVLVGEGDEVRLRRHQPQRPFEVEVEPEPALAPGEGEARVRRGQLAQRRQPLAGGAVVADQADPVGVGLLADRAELALEQRRLRFVGGHADRHQGLGCRHPLSRRRRRGSSLAACAAGSAGRSAARGCRGSRAPSPAAPRR